MEPTAGQKFMSSLVDIVFFVVIGFLGYKVVLKESTLFALLVIYAQGRFSVAKDKQTSMLVANNAALSSQSGQYRAQVTEQASPRKVVIPPATPERARESYTNIEARDDDDDNDRRTPPPGAPRRQGIPATRKDPIRREDRRSVLSVVDGWVRNVVSKAPLLKFGAIVFMLTEAMR